MYARSLDPEQKDQLVEVIEKLLKDQTTVSWECGELHEGNIYHMHAYPFERHAPFGWGQDWSHVLKLWVIYSYNQAKLLLMFKC